MTDRQTDRPTDLQTHRHTDARGKTICLPTLTGGRHNESDCCETRCTAWNDKGKGDTRNLDRHHLDCGSPSKMITNFSLEATKYPKTQIKFMYVCCRFAVPFCRMRAVSNALTESNVALIYLDKKHVDCGDYSVVKCIPVQNKFQTTVVQVPVL